MENGEKGVRMRIARRDVLLCLLTVVSWRLTASQVGCAKRISLGVAYVRGRLVESARSSDDSRDHAWGEISRELDAIMGRRAFRRKAREVHSAPRPCCTWGPSRADLLVGQRDARAADIALSLFVRVQAARSSGAGHESANGPLGRRSPCGRIES